MKLITVDTSVLVAILSNEPHRHSLQVALSQSKPFISCASLLECFMRMKSVYEDDTADLIMNVLNEFNFTVTEFGPNHLSFAQVAFEKFGKGRHPAKLNFGDCIVYATAKLSRTPILCLGNDFAQTDIQVIELTG